MAVINQFLSRRASATSDGSIAGFRGTSIVYRPPKQRLLVLLVGIVVSFASAADSLNAGQPAEVLRHVNTIALEGIAGRIDHMGFDAKQKWLFVAALGNNSVEVVDLTAGKVARRIDNLRAPQGVGFAPESDRLAVANDEDGSLRLYDGRSLQQTATINLNDDADNVRYDAASGRFWVGYGSGGLAAIDPNGGKLIENVVLDAHPESFQLESKGKRIFVNVPLAGHIAVVDRESAKVVGKFRLKEASANFAMALDEPDHRLFVGCRQPAKLLVLETQTGMTVAALDVVGDTDDVFYDAENRRIYVSGGEGYVTVIGQRNADNYEVVGTVATAPGARTSFFNPDTEQLYVAVPHRGGQMAELRVFSSNVAETSR